MGPHKDQVITLDVHGIAHRPYTMQDARNRLFALIRHTPRLTWQLLTKRPENIARMMPLGDWPNVWMGVSIETQEYTPRIDQLLDAPQRFALRWVSVEPLLGPLVLPSLGRDGIGWVVVGGESGSDRPCDAAWVRSIMEQCRYAEVAVFVKQLGANAEDNTAHRRISLGLRHAKGGDITEWPENLQIREFPR